MRLSGIGCIYVAFGRPYLIQALHSVRTLRRHSPTVPVCILTNTLSAPPPAFSDWDATRDVWVHLQDANDRNRLIKTDLARHSPFARTLYLDCDTEVLHDITPMFGFLDHWDIALRLKEEGYSPEKVKGRQRVLDGRFAVHELPHWNSGVVLFASNPRVEEFFSLWRHHLEASGSPFDQAALVDALFRSSVRLLSLDARWNGGAGWAAERPGQKQYVLHYMHGIDERTGASLVALDGEVFVNERGESISAGEATGAFVAARMDDHRRRRRRGGQLARLRGWLIRVARRLLARRTRVR
jgi:hypothetical protein